MSWGGNEWGALGQWVGAAATFLAVAVALRLHVRVLPPVLKLTLQSQDGEATHVSLHKRGDDGEVTSTRGESARYYHVLLENDRAWSLATEVTASLIAIEMHDARGDYTPVWSGSLPLITSLYGIHPTRMLGATPQRFDLCSVIKDKWLALHPLIEPNNFVARYRPEEHARIQLRLTLQASSLETVSPISRFEVAWDGQWAEDSVAMRRHVVVRQVV